jgi:hypothetical protein
MRGVHGDVRGVHGDVRGVHGDVRGDGKLAQHTRLRRGSVRHIV